MERLNFEPRLAYLDTLQSGSGAWRVQTGAHHRDASRRVRVAYERVWSAEQASQCVLRRRFDNSLLELAWISH